jgi:hypothetical protein
MAPSFILTFCPMRPFISSTATSANHYHWSLIRKLQAAVCPDTGKKGPLKMTSHFEQLRPIRVGAVPMSPTHLPIISDVIYRRLVRTNLNSSLLSLRTLAAKPEGCNTEIIPLIHWFSNFFKWRHTIWEWKIGDTSFIQTLNKGQITCT